MHAMRGIGVLQFQLSSSHVNPTAKINFYLIYFISLKVVQWKNGFIKRPHNTETLNFPSPKIDSSAFVLVFVRETTQFLTAKHWLS